MKLKILIASALYFFVAPVFADNQSMIITGSELVDVCEEGLEAVDSQYSLSRKPMTEEQKGASTFCFSFVDGIIQGYLATFTAIYQLDYPSKVKDKNIREKLICVPAIQPRDIVRAVLKNLKDDPKSLDMNAGPLVYNSLLRAFPCE